MKFCLKFVEHFAGKQIDMWPPKKKKMIRGRFNIRPHKMEGPTYKTSVITLLCRFFFFFDKLPCRIFKCKTKKKKKKSNREVSYKLPYN